MATYTTAQLQAIAVQDANKYGVPPQLFLDQITQESGWNPSIKNANSSATGLGQFLTATAQQYGLTDPTDPVASLDAAAHYDADLYAKSGNWNTALTSYSGGNYDANALYAKYGNMDTVTVNPSGTVTGAGNTGADMPATDPTTGLPIDIWHMGTEATNGTSTGANNPLGAAATNPAMQAGAAASQAASALAGSWSTFIQEWGLRVLFVLLGIIIVGAGLFWLAHGAGAKLEGLQSKPA